MKEELLKDLTEEQIAKVKACKSNEEILAVAKEEGIELTDEQLEAVSGGSCSYGKCPNCGSSNTSIECGNYGRRYVCNDCKHTWEL